MASISDEPHLCVMKKNGIVRALMLIPFSLLLGAVSKDCRILVLITEYACSYVVLGRNLVRPRRSSRISEGEESTTTGLYHGYRASNVVQKYSLNVAPLKTV